MDKLFRSVFSIPSALIIILIVGVVSVVKGWMDAEFVFGAVSAVTAILIVVYQYDVTKRNEADARLFEAKAKIYEGIADLVREVTAAQKPAGRRVSEEKLTEKLMKIRAQMIVWSSLETLQAYDRLSALDGKNPMEPFEIMAALYNAMRKDLGHIESRESGPLIVIGIITDAKTWGELEDKMR
jgi:hypothetical protein